jgi:thiamine biosynthesis lipoprotein ApbE
MNTKSKVTGIILVGAIVAFTALGLWRAHGSDDLLMETRPRPSIMSTPQFNLTAVVPAGQADRLDAVFAAAEAAARTVEARMSIYNPASELSGFNAAPAGQSVPLSAETIDVLTQSSVLWEQTQQAFDITVRPLVRLWKQAGKANRLPTPQAIRQAREASRWSYIDILDDAAVKTVATAGVDLGGIAKGYAVDRAVEAMTANGCVGGIVDIGGNLRCFGVKPSRKPWHVGVVNPFRPDSTDFLVVLAVRDKAVCTSGNYNRFQVIDGRHYSHILDPKPRPSNPIEEFTPRGKRPNSEKCFRIRGPIFITPFFVATYDFSACPKLPESA